MLGGARSPWLTRNLFRFRWFCIYRNNTNFQSWWRSCKKISWANKILFVIMANQIFSSGVLVRKCSLLILCLIRYDCSILALKFMEFWNGATISTSLAEVRAGLHPNLYCLSFYFFPQHEISFSHLCRTNCTCTDSD